MKHQLTRLASELGIATSTTFHGQLDQSQLRRHLSRATLLALPSRQLPSGDRDGIANVLLEAMALGVPVITTTAGAAGEIITHRHNGLLVPPEDIPALRHALQTLLSNLPLRTQLSQAARATVEKNFNIHSTSTLLSQLLATCSSTAGKESHP